MSSADGSGGETRIESSKTLLDDATVQDTSSDGDVVVEAETLKQQQQLLFSRPCETARQVFEECGIGFSP